MVHRQSLGVIAAVALLAVLVSSDAARCAVVMSGDPLPDTDGSSTDFNNAKYKVTYANGSLDYGAADVGSQHGTVTITDAFANCEPHKFTFMQTALPMDDPNDTDVPPFPFGTSDGLRVQMALKITNNTGKPWSGFWVKIDDPSIPANLDPTIGGQGSHKHSAHFHPNGVTPPPGPPTVTGMPMANSTGFTTPMNAAIGNTTMFLISGGKQEDAGKGFTMTGFFLHERNLKKAAEGQNPAMAVLRTFDLILMPHCVPEPSAWLLMSLGCVVLARRRCRAR